MSVHSDAAQARVLELRAMRQQIPNFVIPTSKDERRRLTPAASVPPEFVERIGVAVTNSPALVRGGAPDPDQARDLMSYAEAYEPLADEMEAFAAFIRHSVTVARSRAGSEALTTYALARRLAKRPEHGDLVPHVDDMRRILGPRGPKPKARPEPAPTTPAPTTPAPTTPGAVAPMTWPDPS
jgi:hypothetical protein